MGDDVFQLGKLVDLYQVAPSNDLEENLNFWIAKNIFVDFDDEELNDIFSSNEHKQVDEDDSDEINLDGYDGDEDSQLMKNKLLFCIYSI